MNVTTRNVITAQCMVSELGYSKSHTARLLGITKQAVNYVAGEQYRHTKWRDRTEMQKGLGKALANTALFRKFLFDERSSLCPK